MGDSSFFEGMPPGCLQAAASLMAEAVVSHPEEAALTAMFDAAIRQYLPEAGDQEPMWVRHLFYCAMENIAVALDHPDRCVTLAYGSDRVELPTMVETGYLLGFAVLPDWTAVVAFFDWVPGAELRDQLAEQLRDRLGLAEDQLQVLPAIVSLAEAQAGVFGDRFAQVLAARLVDAVDDQLTDRWRQAVLQRQTPQAWTLSGGRYAVPFALPVAVASLVVADYWWPMIPGADDLADAIGDLLAADMRAQDIPVSRLDLVSADPCEPEGMPDRIAEMVKVLDLAGARPLPVVTGSHSVGRNDPCPCGSGKKYKKCCGG
jgi:hypothetical protein